MNQLQLNGAHFQDLLHENLPTWTLTTLHQKHCDIFNRYIWSSGHEKNKDSLKLH